MSLPKLPVPLSRFQHLGLGLRLVLRTLRGPSLNSNSIGSSIARNSPGISQARTFAMPGALSIREHIMNVNNRPLVQHGTDPMTGWYRNGFCETDDSDHGNHTIAGILTEDFLSFSARKGNNLRSVGLAEGCRWCLCVSRWKEAFDAFTRGEVSRASVPLVDLEATHSKALSSGVTLDQLQQFSSRSPDGNN